MKFTGEKQKLRRPNSRLAQQRSFKWWELRATRGLSRLLRDTNQRDEARAMLADIYNWFSREMNRITDVFAALAGATHRRCPGPERPVSAIGWRLISTSPSPKSTISRSSSNG